MTKNAVNTANMKLALQEFRNSSNECRTINTTLTNSIDCLKVSWSGDVAMRFQAVMAAWEEDFTHITGALHRMEQALEHSIHQYEKSSRKAADAIGTLKR